MLAGTSRRASRFLAGGRAAWRRRFLFALFPLGLAWVLERSGLATPSNGVRALSGACLGIVVAAAVLSAREIRPAHGLTEVN
jgi:hypothetical protein